MPNRAASRMTQPPTIAATDVADDRDQPDERVEPDLDGVPGTGTSSSSTWVTRPIRALGGVEALGAAGADDLAFDRLVHPGECTVATHAVRAGAIWTNVHVEFMTDAEWPCVVLAAYVVSSTKRTAGHDETSRPAARRPSGGMPGGGGAGNP